MLTRLLCLVLLACSCNTFKATKTPTVEVGERTLWEACWGEGGGILLPSDTPPHTPKCKSPEAVIWPRGFVRIALLGDEVLDGHLDVAVAQWNVWLGREMFIRTMVGYDVVVALLPENPYLLGMAHLEREYGVQVGAILIYGYNAPRIHHTLLHEMGHILGLAHDVENHGYLMDRWAANEVTMLSPVDIKALRQLYSTFE